MATAKPVAQTGKSKKLGYLEQRERNEMEARVLEAEERLDACRRAAADPVIASDHLALLDRLAALEAAGAEIEGTATPH